MVGCCCLIIHLPSAFPPPCPSPPPVCADAITNLHPKQLPLPQTSAITSAALFVAVLIAKPAGKICHVSCNEQEQGLPQNNCGRVGSVLLWKHRREYSKSTLLERLGLHVELPGTPSGSPGACLGALEPSWTFPELPQDRPWNRGLLRIPPGPPWAHLVASRFQLHI